MSTTNIKKICLNCQKEYIQKRSDRNIKFCSKKCSLEYLEKNKKHFYTCKQCGKNFSFKTKGCTSFCSISCSTICNNIKRSKNGFTTKNKTKKAICIICCAETEIKLNSSTNTAKCAKCNSKKQNSDIYVNDLFFCKICGAIKETCEYPDICKNFMLVPTLIKIGLDKTAIGSSKFYEEFFKIQKVISTKYLVDKASIYDIAKSYSILYSTANKIITYFNIKIRTNSESVNNAILQGKFDNVNSISYPFKSGYHTSWFGQEFLYRSSYELKYAQQLDETKTMYQMESLKILYFDSVQNRNRIAIPDFYLPETNTIVEIKSNYTLELSGGIQNMKDRFKAYKELGYNPILQLDFKEIKFGAACQNRTDLISLEG